MKSIDKILGIKRKIGLVLLLADFLVFGGCASIPEQGKINYPSNTEYSVKNYKKDSRKRTAIIGMIENKDKNKKRFMIDLRELPGISREEISHYPKRFLKNPRDYDEGETIYQGKNLLIREYTKKQEK